jgi:NAD(P)-dependent dehydrogenase (short-subunit alcohol dehydrogenase family)
MKTILITGCSTGIGHAACEVFAERGWKVLAGSRHPAELKFAHANISPIELDVNDVGSIERCFSKISELDCLVNNAGYGLLLPFEDTPREEIEKIFHTNVFGLMDVSRHATVMMRKQGRGTMINISSVLGTIGTPWYAAYSATKWAVEGFSESLAHEMKPFGVHVKIVEPGGTKTEFHNVAYTSKAPISDVYKETFERKRGSRNTKNDYDTAENVAELIWEAANDDSWRLRYSAPQAKKALLGQRLLGRDGLWKKLAK